MTEVKAPYIADKVLFSAVSFAKKLITVGEPVEKWLKVPARYYKISEEALRTEMIRQGFEDKMKESPVPAPAPLDSSNMDDIFGAFA